MREVRGIQYYVLEPEKLVDMKDRLCSTLAFEIGDTDDYDFIVGDIYIQNGKLYVTGLQDNSFILPLSKSNLEIRMDPEKESVYIFDKKKKVLVLQLYPREK